MSKIVEEYDTLLWQYSVRATFAKCWEHRKISSLKRELYLLVLLAAHLLDHQTAVKLETGYSL